MDFSKDEDQIAATKWYIDQLIARFKSRVQTPGTLGLLLGRRRHQPLRRPDRPAQRIYPRAEETFYWIPYWQAKGHEDWKRLGFDVAYQQPNHFFNKSIPDSRLDEACAVARKNGMAMEFEFDERATIAAPDTFYDRMLAYIDRFEKNDVFNASAVAYYCGNRGVLTLFESNEHKDKVIMDRLARIIYTRQVMKYGLPVKNKTRVVAHRGFWHTDGSAENSVSSLLNADKLGAYGAEFDVWMAADGKLVIHHDDKHGSYEMEKNPRPY